MGIEALLQKRITTLRKERFQLDKAISKLELTQKQLNELKEGFDKPFTDTSFYVISGSSKVEKHKKEFVSKRGDRKGRVLKYLPVVEKSAVTTNQVATATKYDGEMEGRKLLNRTQQMLNDLYKKGFILKKKDPLSGGRALLWWAKP